MISKKICILVIVISAIAIGVINIVYEFYISEKIYTLSYSDIWSGKEDLFNNVVNIDDVVVTKGSILILVTLENGNQDVWQFERGYVSLNYKLNPWTVSTNDLPKSNWGIIQDRFEEFEYTIINNQIINKPATFKTIIDWNGIVSKWYSPTVLLSILVIHVMNKIKSNKS